MKRAALVLLLLTETAGAFENPALDDFYARTAARTQGFKDCAAPRDCQYVLRFLLGTQVANPSPDQLHPKLAEGLRLGGDAGVTLTPLSVTRTAAWVDLLRVQETGERLRELTLKHTTFYTTAEDRHDAALNVSLDLLAGERSELGARDYAELQLEPYRILDGELELAAIGPPVDKDGNLAFPVGVAYRQRYDEEGDLTETRTSLSGAIAVRAFPNLLDTPDEARRRHYQLDVLRLTRVDWDTEAEDAAAWRLSAGYQRLSPGIPGFDIWLLIGYGWHEAANEATGWLAQLGAEQTIADAHQAGVAYDGWFALDRAAGRFERTHNTRLFYRYERGGVSAGLSYEYVAVEGRGALHSGMVRGSWHPEWAYGLGLGVRQRVALAEDKQAPEQERVNLSLDWLF